MNYSNRAERRADVKAQRRRAKAAARAHGCTCHAELILSPVNGRPVWAERPNSEKKVWVIRHARTCPMYSPSESAEWVIATPTPEKQIDDYQPINGSEGA